MKLSPEDPKLTAYVLGELDATETAAVEAALKESPECRQAVAEIRETAGWLKKELAAEQLPAAMAAFAKAEKAPPASGAADKKIVPFPVRRVVWVAGLSAAAACLVAAVFLPSLAKSKNKAMARTSVGRQAENERENENALRSELATIRTEQKPVPDQGLTATVTFRNSSGAAGSEKSKEESARNTSTPSPEAAASSLAMTASLTGDKKSPFSSGTTERFAYKGEVRGGAVVYSQQAVGYVDVPAQGRNFALGVPASSPARPVLDAKLQRRVDYAYGLPAIQGGRDNSEGQWGWGLKKADSQGTASYPAYAENVFESVRNAPLSTFSIDVDTAAYANMRRFLNQGQLPPADALRIEELVNYFSYDYAGPKNGDPFAAHMEVAGCPWNAKHRLVRVGLKGREVAQDKRPASNFIFLIDVSGSMQPAERLPLIKQALRQLVKRMTENDRIGIVVYASSSGVVLESTSCVNKEKILEAIDRLEAGGSTNGGEGIQRAYGLAEEHFIKGGVNRVILCTDGDFNVGTTSQSALVELIQQKAKSGVFLTVLGVGTDNYKDSLMQNLADKGNGNYSYLDTPEEADKVLIQQMNGTLMTIAKDVKIQVEFNPAQVQSYRLIGYEKRMLAAEDFNNDKKDAGEIGAGHTVTALYEVVPVGVEEDEPRPGVDPLKYQDQKTPAPKAERPAASAKNGSKELLTLKLRYKQPDGDKSQLLEFPLVDAGRSFERASTDFRFAVAVAGYGMILKDSEYAGDTSLSDILETAQGAKGTDKEGYRAEFLNLVKKAKELKGK